MEFSDEFKSLFKNKEQPLSENKLSKMSHSELYLLRSLHSGDKQAQEIIAPYEHKQFAYELIKESPSYTIPMVGATVGYQAAKSVGIDIGDPEDVGMATPSSMKQLQFGLEGIGKGLKELLGFKEEPSKQVSEGTIKQRPTAREEVDSIMDRLIHVESTTQHKEGKDLITSPAGAKGITQVMPHTGKIPGYGVSPLKNSTKEEYIRFAKDYLIAMKEKFGDMEKALAAYNAGPGKVNRAIIRAERKGKNWKEFLPKETQEYIKKVQLGNVDKGMV